MDGLVIGIDLCDTYTQISCLEPERTWVVPTVICKKKYMESWFVGEEAYALTLVGDGIIVDQLVKLVEKDGTSTIEGTKYQGQHLLELYLERLLELPKKELGQDQIKQLVISLETVEAKILDSLMYAADYLKIPRDRVHMISHTEGFVYYVMSQKREIWSNQVGMFCLEDEALHYYELKIQRGLRQLAVVAEGESLDEGFNLNILQNASGARLADKILCSCGERFMQKKLFSSIILTGKGFEHTDWASNFMKFVCNRRKVFVESSVFAKGAAYKAADYLREKTSYPFSCICEGRLKTSVSLKVMNKDKETQLILASAGDSWYESKSVVDLIVDNQNEVEFVISPADPKKKKMVRIPLEGFPKRPNKTTRIQVSVGFTNERTMVALIKDCGFGDLFPATDVTIKQEVLL